MTFSEFYGYDEYRKLQAAENQLMELISNYSNTKSEHEGVKAIVDAHSGKIQAWTKDGHSFQITATFPM